MMPTPYCTVNGTFSTKAHFVAEQQIYPTLFNTNKDMISFKDTTIGSVYSKGGVLDGEMAIDYIASVSTPCIAYPIEFPIQERFRRIQYRRYQDMTITTYNKMTQLKSELFKLKSGLFVYGYFDETVNSIFDWIVVDVTKLLLAISGGNIYYETKENKRSFQEFIGIKFKDLYCGNVVVCSSQHCYGAGNNF